MENPSLSFQDKIDTLESTVKQLLTHCETFQDSNKQLMQERADLITKNEKVRSQIEAMVDRLKSAESSS